MAEKAYIVEAVRTAGGKRDGRLSLWHPADLGAKVLATGTNEDKLSNLKKKHPEIHIEKFKLDVVDLSIEQLIDIIKFRQNKKWYISISVVALFSTILALMIYFMSNGVDVQSGWKEILLLMLGGFVGSFAKVIDFWFNNAEDDTKLLEHADD